jgi:hypothetical protein
MISYRSGSRVLRIGLAMFASVVVAACRPSIRETPREKPAEIALPSQGSLIAFEDIRKALVEFPRGPGHFADCQGCTDPRSVSIQSIGLTKDIKAGAGPAKMRVVAMIHNYSTDPVQHTSSRVTFKSGTDYLMWIAREKGGTRAVWGLIELGPDYANGFKPIGPLNDCGHYTSKISEADFRDCTKEVTGKKVIGGFIKSAYAAPVMQATITLSTWISCDPGCCTGAADLQ